MKLNHRTDLYPPEVHSAVWALYKALGVPVRSPIILGRNGQVDQYDTLGLHPVFGLISHGRGNDHYDASGETLSAPPGAPYKGDVLSIPCYREDGSVLVLQISFHKGCTYVERIDFPGAPEPVQSALYDLLDALETR